MKEVSPEFIRKGYETMIEVRAFELRNAAAEWLDVPSVAPKRPS